MTIKVSMVLQQKGSDVVVIAASQDVASVADLLTSHRIGAAPVVDDGRKIVGMLSERDIMRAISKHGAAALAMPAETFMSREVKSCAPDDAIVELMEVMTTARVRHLPVMAGGSLVGIVSIGDVVKQRLDEAQAEVEALRSYIAS